MLSSTGIRKSMVKCNHYNENGSSTQSMDEKSQCIPIFKDLILYLLGSDFENLMILFRVNQPNKSFHALLNAMLLYWSHDRNAHQ
jgi:hypothetical protein